MNHSSSGGTSGGSGSGSATPSAGGNGPKSAQGGGELSGLLRHAEVLQRDLEKALADLAGEVIETQDGARLVTLRITGNGAAKEVKVAMSGLDDAQRRHLEEAFLAALRCALDRLFEVRRKRATAVTKGLALPGIFL